MWGLVPRIRECGQSAWDVPDLGDRLTGWSLMAGLKPDKFEIFRGRLGELWVAKADGGLGWSQVNLLITGWEPS